MNVGGGAPLFGAPPVVCALCRLHLSLVCASRLFSEVLRIMEMLISHPNMAPAAVAQRADAAAAATLERASTRLHEQRQLVGALRAKWDLLESDPDTAPFVLEQARGCLAAEEYHLEQVFVRDCQEARALLAPDARRADPVQVAAENKELAAKIFAGNAHDLRADDLDPAAALAKSRRLATEARAMRVAMRAHNPSRRAFTPAAAGRAGRTGAARRPRARTRRKTSASSGPKDDPGGGEPGEPPPPPGEAAGRTLHALAGSAA